MLRRRQAKRPSADGKPRLLVPFTGGALDSVVLDAAIRIARAEGAVLVPAFLLVLPRDLAPDAPGIAQVELAMPLLEAVEIAGLEAGIPVDARIERGRTATHALQRLWEVEPFDEIVIPAQAGSHSGFTSKELAWMLEHAPAQTIVLRPAPDVAPT